MMLRREFLGRASTAIALIGSMKINQLIQPKPIILKPGMVTTVPIDMIKIDHDHVRYIKDYRNDIVSELAASINEIGLMTPIIITANFNLITGYRRLKACKELKHTTIKVQVSDNKPIFVTSTPAKQWVELRFKRRIHPDGRVEITRVLTPV